MNNTCSFQQEGIQKLAHELFPSRNRREKESNTGIGIYFKYIDAAQFISKIPKFGDVDLTGGVTIDRGRTYELVMNISMVVPSLDGNMENVIKSNPMFERSIGNGLDIRSVLSPRHYTKTKSTNNVDLRSGSVAEDISISLQGRKVTDINEVNLRYRR